MDVRTWGRRLPWDVVVLTLLILAAGLTAMARCDELAGAEGRFFQRQAGWALLAIVALGAATWPPHRILFLGSYPFYAATLALLVAVYFAPALNGAHRWIRLGPLGIQPSELAKVAYVLALARYLATRGGVRRLGGLVGPVLLTLVPAALILREPDLGTASIFVPVLLLMLFAAGARKTDLAAVCVAGLFLAPLLWTHMSPEQRSRVTGLFQQSRPSEKPGDDAFQLHQGKQVLALGGMWGSALADPGGYDPADYFLPEARSDFVFCIWGERYGVWGGGVLLLLYAGLLWRGQRLASAASDPFARLLASGVVGLLAVQVLINTGMNVGLLPVTGVSLPLVSYGGSGLVAHGLAVGLLLNAGMRGERAM